MKLILRLIKSLSYWFIYILCFLCILRRQILQKTLKDLAKNFVLTSFFLTLNILVGRVFEILDRLIPFGFYEQGSFSWKVILLVHQ